MNEILGLPLFLTALALGVWLLAIRPQPVLTLARKIDLASLGVGLLTFNVVFITGFASFIGIFSLIGNVCFFVLINLLMKAQLAKKAVGQPPALLPADQPVGSKFWLTVGAGALTFYFLNALVLFTQFALLVVLILPLDFVIIGAVAVLLWKKRAEFFPPDREK